MRFNSELRRNICGGVRNEEIELCTDSRCLRETRVFELFCKFVIHHLNQSTLAGKYKGA